MVVVQNGGSLRNANAKPPPQPGKPLTSGIRIAEQNRYCCLTLEEQSHDVSGDSCLCISHHIARFKLDNHAETAVSHSVILQGTCIQTQVGHLSSFTHVYNIGIGVAQH